MGRNGSFVQKPARTSCLGVAGKIVLEAATRICSEGDVLTPEQCSILELFNEKMARLEAKLVCMWSADTFKMLDD